MYLSYMVMEVDITSKSTVILISNSISTSRPIVNSTTQVILVVVHAANFTSESVKVPQMPYTISIKQFT